MPNINRLCFLKNIVKDPNVIVGDYTYYDDPENVELIMQAMVFRVSRFVRLVANGKMCRLLQIIKAILSLAMTFGLAMTL